MICPECQDDDHEHCYDNKHPQQEYRGCAPASTTHGRTNPLGNATRRLDSRRAVCRLPLRVGVACRFRKYRGWPPSPC